MENRFASLDDINVVLCRPVERAVFGYLAAKTVESPINYKPRVVLGEIGYEVAVSFPSPSEIYIPKYINKLEQAILRADELNGLPKDDEPAWAIGEKVIRLGKHMEYGKVIAEKKIELLLSSEKYRKDVLIYAQILIEAGIRKVEVLYKEDKENLGDRALIASAYLNMLLNEVKEIKKRRRQRK